MAPHLDSERRVGIVPDGVIVAPEAERHLERALIALRDGRPVSAWTWAERAVAVLRESRGGEVMQKNPEKSTFERMR